jgi:amidase
MVPMGHASDGGGSIRIPAACCGLVGLKVTQGRMTMGPLRAENALGVEHCVTRTVRDTAALLDATHGPGVGDMVIAPPPSRPYAQEVGAPTGRLRIGVMTSNPNGDVDAECAEAARSTARLLESLGHHVEDRAPAAFDDLPAMSKVFMSMWCIGAAQNIELMGSLIGRTLTRDDVEPYTWLLADMGRSFSGLDYAKSLGATVTFRRAMARWWASADEGGQGFDLLLTPTLSILPPRIGELKAHPDHPENGRRNGAMSAFTSAFNITGQPAISLPLHTSAEGLPIGVQLVAALGREDVLLRVASQLEAAAPWADRRPVLA